MTDDPTVTGSGDVRRRETAEPSAIGYLQVVRGDPAPEELAAITAVIAAASGSAGDVRRVPPTGPWAASTRPRPRTPRAGPGAWAASARG